MSEIRFQVDKAKDGQSDESFIRKVASPNPNSNTDCGYHQPNYNHNRNHRLFG